MRQQARGIFRLALFFGAAFGSGVLQQNAASAQESTQFAIAQALRSADTGGFRTAMGEMLRIPVAEQGPELRAAIVDVLRRHQEGNTDLGDVHAVVAFAEVALEIAQTGDPVAIPALASFPMAGWRIYWALVSLGEPALRAVLDAAASPASSIGTVEGALKTLEMFVDEWGVEAFDEQTYGEMKSVAARHLQGPSYWAVLDSSIGLAVLLDDPVLRSKVEELAASDEAVHAHGIEEAHIVQLIREKAAERLADPAPWWREYLCEVRQCAPGNGAS